MAEEQTSELLKKKRKSFRTAVTKVVNELEAELSNSDLNIDRLSELVETLSIKFEPLTLVDQQLEPLFKPEQFDGEFEITEEYREKVLLWQFRAKKKINEYLKPRVTSPSFQTTLSQSQDEHFRDSDNIRIKVPKYYITRFYGDDASKWLTFWNSFETAVHNNESLNKVDKFNYLKAHLGGSALNTVEGFPISAKAYDEAVELLKNRFANPEILIQAHMNKILSLQPLKNSNDLRSFRKFVDNCNVQLRSLNSLGVSSANYGKILCPMLLKLIPSDLLLDYNKLQQNGSGSDIQQLLSFLTQSLTAREQTYSTNKSSFELCDRRQKTKSSFSTRFHRIVDTRETKSKEEVTKRRILSLAHRIFDPIGFTCPIILIPKLLIQECWKIEASWDSKLPVDIERKFEAWKKQLIEIQDIKITRRLSNLDLKDANLSLRFFRDATKSSYARHDFHFPFILSSNHPVIKARINYKHAQLDHDGVQMLMYRLRKNYWILKGIRTIKEVIKICIICKRSNVKPISVSERLLLQDRVRDTAIFEIKGKDLARPLILKSREKNWILILICTVDRAIYLELLTSIWTVSGTNFKGDYRLYQKVNLEKLKNLEELNPISWKFIPPQAPWWGGFWERLIGLMKRTLRKTSLNQEEMYTVLCDCESLINSRPLTYVTDDVEDLEPLTPAMFLQDIREVGVPELDRIDENKLNKRLVYRNRIQTDLRKRFRVEYLGQLRKIKNVKGEDTLSEGDIVLVGDDHTKRINWNLGKILKLYPGKDEKVRAAQVKTKLGTFLRPVQKLYLLEVMEKTKSFVHPTNSPLFSDANEGSHLPINIDPELSKHQGAATPLTQPCSSVSNGGARLEPRAETSSHQQAETSPMQLCSSVSNSGGELRQVDTSRRRPLRCSPVPVFPMVKPEWSRELRPLNFQMT
ncbi:integrase catalytic domain-containing protein [Trichonephila clavata]|uniref:Integrase catalytic domain-containing protein n=1 Tax=Trichonephila clavata TaxID=2740835 RepID=A0A8X6HWV3_TRICU|nr:integrase catalytic domain-containing protein [Trichonephila clavata]